jgi:hypothetical protein
LHLAKRIDQPGHKLYFDNFIGNYSLFEMLKIKGINAIGTVRANRFHRPPFADDKVYKQKGRGFSEEISSRNQTVAMVKWYDNRSVYLASNFIGKGNQTNVRRWSKEEKNMSTLWFPKLYHYTIRAWVAWIF